MAKVNKDKIKRNLIPYIKLSISGTLKYYKENTNQEIFYEAALESLFEVAISNSFFINIKNNMRRGCEPSYNKSEILDKFSAYLDANVDRISKESELLWNKIFAENVSKASNNIFNQN